MVLYLKEFEERHQAYGFAMSKYDVLTGDTPFHELPSEEVIKLMTRHGVHTIYRYKAAINFYLKWLQSTYGIDVRDLYFEINKFKVSQSTEHLGFFDFNDMQNAINDAEITIEANTDTQFDFKALYTTFYLEWLGIKPEDTITINLSDVTEFGHKVYIPSLDKTITIDNENIANFIWSYKNTEGVVAKNCTKLTPYCQTTLCRTVRGKGVYPIKSIYTSRNNFTKWSGDKRFSKSNIYYSGMYYRLYQRELELNLSIAEMTNKSIIEEVFGKEYTQDRIKNIMRGYAAYKKGYLQYLK